MLFRRVSVIVLIALTSSLGACSTPSPVPTPVVPTATATIPPATAAPSAARATPTQGVTPTPNLKDPLLAALSSALSKIKTYRARVPEEGRLMEVVLPDRIRQAAEDTTRIGGTFYQYDIYGNLLVRQIGTVPFMDRVNLVWFQDQVSKSSGVATLVPATIDGTPTTGYSTNFTISKITPPTTPGATPVVNQEAQLVKVWFSITDGYPRRIEYGPPVSVTVDFFDFNASIEINPPSP